MKESCHESLKQNIWSSKKSRQSLRIKTWRSVICTHLTRKRTWHDIAPQLKIPISRPPRTPTTQMPPIRIARPMIPRAPVSQVQHRKVEGIGDLMTWSKFAKTPKIFISFSSVCSSMSSKNDQSWINRIWVTRNDYSNQPWALWFPKPKLPNLGSCP